MRCLTWQRHKFLPPLLKQIYGVFLILTRTVTKSKPFRLKEPKVLDSTPDRSTRIFFPSMHVSFTD